MPSSSAIAPRLRSRIGPRRRSGPMCATASRLSTMAACGSAAHPRSSRRSCGPIYEAMEQVYTGDARGNPFAWLSEIECPVTVTTAGKSGPIYKEMASRAMSLIPHARALAFDGAGHCVAHDGPY